MIDETAVLSEGISGLSPSIPSASELEQRELRSDIVCSHAGRGLRIPVCLSRPHSVSKVPFRAVCKAYALNGDFGRYGSSATCLGTRSNTINDVFRYLDRNGSAWSDVEAVSLVDRP